MSALYVWGAVVTAPVLALMVVVLIGLVVHLDHRVDQLRDAVLVEQRAGHDQEIRAALLERQLEAAVDFLSADLAGLPTGPDQAIHTDIEDY